MLADEILDELEAVKREGAGPGLERLDLPILKALAQHVRDDPVDENVANDVEALLRRGIERFGRGDAANAITSLLGLDVRGRNLTQRRNAAADECGRASGDSFRRTSEDDFLRDLANQLAALAAEAGFVRVRPHTSSFAPRPIFRKPASRSKSWTGRSRWLPRRDTILLGVAFVVAVVALQVLSHLLDRPIEARELVYADVPAVPSLYRVVAGHRSGLPTCGGRSGLNMDGGIAPSTSAPAVYIAWPGTSVWRRSITLRPDETLVHVLVAYMNTTSDSQSDLWMHVWLPKTFRLVGLSTCLYEQRFPNGAFIFPDIVTKRVYVGNISVDSAAYVVFSIVRRTSRAGDCQPRTGIAAEITGGSFDGMPTANEATISLAEC